MNVKNLLFSVLMITSISISAQSVDQKKALDFIKKELLLTQEEENSLKSNQYMTNFIYESLNKKSSNKENKKFLKELIKSNIAQKAEFAKYTKENYPGKEDGYPFEWWKDEKWIKENLKMGF